MKWHEIILKERGREIFSSAAAILAFALMLSLWRFAFGKSFEWKDIEPIELPTVLHRGAYSAATFFSSGAVLFFSGFYKKLHDIVVKEFGNWKLYKDIKKVVWTVLMVFTYWILPKIVHALNVIVSFFYNILTLALYLAPALGTAVIAFIATFLLLKSRNAAEPEVVRVTASDDGREDEF